jgi:hypothetical protein
VRLGELPLWSELRKSGLSGGKSEEYDGTLELGNFVTISAINNATTLAAETHARAHSMKTIR